MAQIIQLRHSTTAAATPDSADGTTTHLLPGEPAVTIAATATKLWVGDAAANRLIFSTDTGDTTLVGNQFLKLTGGALTGAVTTNQTTFATSALVTRDYVDTAVATAQLYQGTYNAATNVPDLSQTANHPTVNGAYFIVDTAGTIPITVPGITTPTPVNPGDHLVWNNTLSEFSIIPAGGMTQSDGDARYLRLAGGTMDAGAVITMPTGYVPSAALHVATKSYADGLVTNMLTAVAVDGTTIIGGGTGAIGSATNPLEVGIIDGGTY